MQLSGEVLERVGQEKTFPAKFWCKETEEKDLILDFILALQAQPAARTIRSRIGNGPLSGDIASFYARLSAGQEKAKHVAPLLKLVLTLKSGIAPQNSDADIWTAVLDLIARTKPLLPPQPTTPPQSHPSITSSFQHTPWSFNTASFTDASEHRKQVDDVLREELLPTLRIDIPDFIPDVFGHVPRLDELAETVFDRCQQEDTRLYTEGSGWTKWPPSAKEDLVLEWLQDHMKRFVAWTNSVHPTVSRQIYKGPSTYLDGSPIKRKMDVGVMACHGQSKTDHGNTHTPKSNWAQMLVTGELKYIDCTASLVLELILLDAGVSQPQLLQILGHRKIETFQKHYQSTDVVVDVQATFLGSTSKSDMVKEISKLCLRQDPKLLRRLTMDEKL
ncbi:MAG: hypothetical protein Q9178_008056 [Gyalolechia marmorata]